MTGDIPTLRHKLSGSELLHVMATHSPLSARLAEEAGFDALWASGFELSALYGVPDASFVSMTQHLDMTRAIAAQVRLPIVADIDTGFGNANNVFHAIREYERAGAAAVVIEDKSFPKVTSLVAGGRQDLVRIEEFQGKIEAALAARRSADFLVIARCEALIAGLGQQEALARCQAYERAGADLLLIHSKSRTPDEIEAFVRAWNGKLPLVIVPTSYPELDAQRIAALGGKVRMVIYGNHAIRAATAAMADTFRRIRADGGALGVQAGIAPVEEIFRLQGMEDFKRLEKKYLR
ncbi:phosphonopyruvate hydrolase [Ramlibacter sp. G-1-2-2]|uniref:Phosphonopyruvate hydrolase n=1 Tax=Ramlibacter agri TaxID=2728837 RepID=A0A848HDE5_9BURK|nr:phosphonopyruvate hydrolase [Ramlibacter agri]NML47391.1 phosphonopyruvate hydrolase [Ramlibacter agri]